MRFKSKLTQRNHIPKNQSNDPENVPTSVLLIEEQKTCDSLLKRALVNSKYLISEHISYTGNIIEKIELTNPNILVLSMDLPSDKIFKELAEINKILPLPIVIFAENDSPKVIKNAIKAGVSAYVVHEISPPRIKSIISVAIERFKAVQARSEEHTSELQSRL